MDTNWEKKLEKDWKAFLDKCYSKGTTEDQRVQLRQMFFVGNLNAVLNLLELANLDEEKAVKALEDMYNTLIVKVIPDGKN